MRSWSTIKEWRKKRRAELIGARTAFPPGERREWNTRITRLLEAGFPVQQRAVVGFCWPYRGEFDLRFLLRRWRDAGVVTALPEVVESGHPLRFREWWPGAPMKRGVYDIPVPDGTDVLLPDFTIVPMNGFDGGGYRLGYGGGYFDRTLAALGRRALAIGVAFEALRMPTIYPQPHDIPMDFVVTEAGIYRAGGEELERIDTTACAAEATRLLEIRALPRYHRPATAFATGDPGAACCSSPPCYAGELAPDS